MLALDGLDLEAADGELLAVVGPSGSGKTTLLRCIAGFDRPDAGRIEVGGRDVTEVAASERDVAMVFQDYALYPHLTSARNITYGLRARKVPPDQIDAKLSEVAVVLQIEDILDRRPHELSGGERQRVALARALVREPRAFLMDEPLSSLDAELRARTRVEIKALQKRIARTTVYVTHDQVEAMTVGDRVAVLRSGHVEQVDEPLALYENPANTFVARFIGSPPMNLFPASLLDGPGRDDVTVGVRPERMHLVDPTHDGVLRGTIELIEMVGPEAIVHIESSGHNVLVKVHPHEAPPQGSSVGIGFAEGDMRFFDPGDGRALP